MAGSSEYIDVRALAGTFESLAYQDGGLFPLLVALPDGTMLGVARGRAGHVGIEGRLDAIRSKDGGRTWSSTATIADSARDDRNPALGVTTSGIIVLSYRAGGAYDAAGKTDNNTGDPLAEMGLWSFGLPYAESLPNGEVLVVYNAGTKAAMDLHWVRLQP